MKRVLCIWLPHWPLQRIAATRPELQGRPVVLYETYVPLPSDPLADREALEELAAWCRQFSPIVGIEAPVPLSSSLLPPSPDSLLLDVTGLAHLFGGEEALSRKIIEQFAADWGLAVRVAVADTLGAAWAVAHFGEGQIANCKLQIANCKLQTAGQSSSLNNSSFIIHHSSFLAVPPGETLAALRGLPIEALRLPAKVVELLHPLGIHRIGQLESLPRAELAARLGASIVLRWDQATGQAAEPIPGSPLPAELQARESLEYPTARREAVEWILRQLIGQVAQKLLECGRGAMQLQCRLECSSDASPPATRYPPPTTSAELSVGLFEPTASPRHLFQLVQLQLERLSIPAPVVGIAVEVTATAPLICRQESLFADGPGRTGWFLAGLIDRLASRLGRNCVLRPRLLPEAQPELACRYEPLIGGRERQNAKCKMQNAKWATSPRSSFIIHHSSFPPSPLHPFTPSSPPSRPLRLLRSPQPLAAMSIIPEGPPLRFVFRGHEHRMARAWGPERIETGWWRGRPIGRDYYRLETFAGRRFWLFRRLDDGRWFLHGTFE